MKRAFAILGILASLAAGLAAQPGGPILVTVGPMNCGLRLLSPALGQTWCFWNAAPNPVSTICNKVVQIFQTSAAPPVVAGADSCFATDTTASILYQITWLVFAARPPTTAGYIEWQVVTTTSPCTVNPATEVCVSSGSATTNTQQGNFPSGVATSLVGELWYTNSEAPAILAAPGFAQSYGRGANCTVISQSGGLATWISTASGTKVEWLNDGWCPSPPGPPPAIFGDCQPETMQLKYARMIGTNAPACSTIPSEPATILTQAYLGDPQDLAEDEAPTPQTAPVPVNLQAGTSYTLQPSDNGALIEFTSSQPVTLSVPAGLGAGFAVTVVQMGAGAVTPTGVTGSGVVLNQRLKLTKSAGQYAWFDLLSTSPDVFDLEGDLALQHREKTSLRTAL